MNTTFHPPTPKFRQYPPANINNVGGTETPFYGKSTNLAKSIMKGNISFDTPSKRVLAPGGEWAEKLQQSLSPKKRNRNVLRQSQAAIMGNTPFSMRMKQSTMGPGPETAPIMSSVELINSVYGKPPGLADKGTGKFQWPYAKKQKTNHDEQEQLSALSRTVKPHWNTDGSMIIPSKDLKTPAGMVMQQFPFEEGSFVGHFVKTPKLDGLHDQALQIQERMTSFGRVDGAAPVATTSQYPSTCRFAHFIELSAAPTQETEAWQLASILFDSPSVSDEAELDRLDSLRAFWRKLTLTDMANQARSTKSLTEKAFIYLSGGDVTSAVSTLYAANCPTLALLVTQIESDNTFKDHCKAQMGVWKARKFASEFPDDIRAIYSVLQGDTSLSPSIEAVGHEDRLPAIHLSQHYKLDWRRAFGLRLWYGYQKFESIEAIVEQFVAEMSNGNERVSVVPHWLQSEDVMGTDREDVLWGILKLYASRRGTRVSVDASFLSPENYSPNMRDSRLAFQLSQLLRTHVEMGPAGPPISGLDEVCDRFAYVYHEQLLLNVNRPTEKGSSNSENSWALSLFPLLHVRDGHARERATREILSRYAAVIPEENTPLFNRLNSTFDIPRKWLFSAKAEYAKAVLDDPFRQSNWLLRAELWKEAHEVLRTTVGPRAIIEGDIYVLRRLLERFIVARAPDLINDWEAGGGLLLDFVQLIDYVTAERSANPVDPNVTKAKRECIIRLTSALATARKSEELHSRWDVLQRAAMCEMSRLLSVAIERDPQLARTGSVVIRLPLEADLQLRFINELSGRYFQSVLGGASQGSGYSYTPAVERQGMGESRFGGGKGHSRGPSVSKPVSGKAFTRRVNG